MQTRQRSSINFLNSMVDLFPSLCIFLISIEVSFNKKYSRSANLCITMIYTLSSSCAPDFWIIYWAIDEHTLFDFLIKANQSINVHVIGSIAYDISYRPFVYHCVLKTPSNWCDDYDSNMVFGQLISIWGPMMNKSLYVEEKINLSIFSVALIRKSKIK